MKATGNCFANSARYILARPGERLLLCHGIVTGQAHLEGREFGHAWVEKDDLAYDVTTNARLEEPLVLPAALYRQVGQARNVIEYSSVEMYALLREHKHFGPWEDALCIG